VVRAVWACSCCCEEELHKALLEIRDLIHPREEVDVNYVAQRGRCIRVVQLLLLLLLLGGLAGLLLWHNQVKVEELHAQLLAQCCCQC
jgi:hypothetical protein